jgi:LysM repeat protein
MLTHKHWFVGIGILIAGSLAAMPFQRHTMDGDSNSQELSIPPNLNALTINPVTEHPLPLPAGLIDSPAAAALYATNATSTERRDQKPIVPPDAMLMPAPIPQIADHFPQSDISLIHASTQLANLPSAGDAPRIITQHRIRNGDTLASIAQHYLGAAQLADWIYVQNRPLIRSPHLLPIGTEINIPAKPQPGQFERFDVSPMPEQPMQSDNNQRKPIPPAPAVPPDDHYKLQLNPSK